jgi:hypothetical protein
LQPWDQSTIDGIEIVRFCAFAPPGSPLDRRYISSISTAEFGMKSAGAQSVVPRKV